MANLFGSGYAYPQYQPQNGPYTSDYTNPYMNVQPQRNTGRNPIIWIQGEGSAKAYPVGPGETVSLWDSEAQTIYLKSADMSGMPSMKILDYTIRDETKRNPVSNANSYVTHEELEKRLAEIVSRETKEGKHE